MQQEYNNGEELDRNYRELKEILETGLAEALKATGFHEEKRILIDIQSHFRGSRLRREEREELYNRLQAAFAVVNKNIEDERLDFELSALSNYADLRVEVDQAVALSEGAENTREAWDALIAVQTRLKESKLFREQREELYGRIQETFTRLRLIRDQEHQAAELESRQNYLRLKALVDKGLLQAEESHEYKETREFLKKIQSEFKGLKLSHEQREELYARLQTAFDILGKRLDDFFRHKKKNWEVKMQFTLSRFSADIFELEQALVKEEADLSGLEDQLEIVISSGKDRQAILGLESRIASARRGIELKKRQIRDLDDEKASLAGKLEEPGN